MIVFYARSLSLMRISCIFSLKKELKNSLLDHVLNALHVTGTYLVILKILGCCFLKKFRVKRLFFFSILALEILNQNTLQRDSASRVYSQNIFFSYIDSIVQNLYRKKILPTMYSYAMHTLPSIYSDYLSSFTQF